MLSGGPQLGDTVSPVYKVTDLIVWESVPVGMGTTLKTKFLKILLILLSSFNKFSDALRCLLFSAAFDPE